MLRSIEFLPPCAIARHSLILRTARAFVKVNASARLFGHSRTVVPLFPAAFRLAALLASAVFFILPMASAVFLNYVIAVYLLVGGATLLIEAFSMNDLKAD